MSVANIQKQGPPLPPPPPPILQAEQKNNDNVTTSSSSLSSTCYEQLCIDESIIKQEIHNFLEIVTPYNNSDDDNKTDVKAMNLIIYSHLKPILQIGPVCGIVALAMAGQNNENKDEETNTNSDTILQEAIKLGCTNKGEMFSALAMVQLANTVFSSHEAILMNNRGRNSNDIMKTILTTILDGNTILVPYDADFNHSPALRRGHGAHWAILHGILLTLNTQTTNNEKNKEEEEQKKNLSELYLSLKELLNQSNKTTISKDEQQQQQELHEQETVQKLEQQKNNRKNTIILRPENITIELKNKMINLFKSEYKYKCFAICHQGKSKYTGIWDFLDLIKSNENLIQVSPKITENQQIDPLILFDMVEFLSHKMVILKRKP